MFRSSFFGGVLFFLSFPVVLSFWLGWWRCIDLVWLAFLFCVEASGIFYACRKIEYVRYEWEEFGRIPFYLCCLDQRYEDRKVSH